MSRLRSVILGAIVAATLAACSSNAGSSPQPTVDGGNGQSVKASTAATTASTPPLPGSLPTFTSPDTTEQTMRALITIAAQHAVGAPSEDRNPPVTATSDFLCPPDGVKMKAEACQPATATDTVAIDIDPDLTWQQFQEPIGYGGGDAVTQDAVLSAYAEYLAYREVQRTHADLLGVTFTSPPDKAQQAIAVIAQTSMCKTGEVFAGLQSAMSPELRQMWQADANTKLGSYFVKGTRGEC